MPRGLSPVGLHSSGHSLSYAQIGLDGFNPWPMDTCSRQFCFPVDDAVLLDSPEPCAKRQRIGIVERRLSPEKVRQRRHALWARDVEEVKRRRCEAVCRKPIAEKIEAELEGAKDLTDVPTEASASSHSVSQCLDLVPFRHISILDSIRAAFSPPEITSLPPLRSFPSAWHGEYEDDLELPNLVIFKDKGYQNQQLTVWPPSASSSSSLPDADAEDLPGLVIFPETGHARVPGSPVRMQDLEPMEDCVIEDDLMK